MFRVKGLGVCGCRDWALGKETLGPFKGIYRVIGVAFKGLGFRDLRFRV